MKQKLYLVFVSVVVILTACGTPTQSAQNNESYTVNLTPADFISAVDNQYFPLSSGMKWVYEATLEDGSKERNEVEVLPDTKVIMGVTAVVVHDVVYDAQGEMVEVTYDWYAQDKDGN